MDDYSEGRLDLERYRGRCCYPFPLQAAEYFVRRELSILGVEELVLSESARTNDHSIIATFALGDGRRAEAEVKVDRSGDHHRLTCGSVVPALIPRYELTSLKLRS